MPRDENIGAGTSGRSTDIGGSHSGGKAGDEPHKAFGPGTPASGEAISGDDDARPEGTPDDEESSGR